MDELFLLASIPQRPLKPGAGFVRPGSAWPFQAPQTVEEVQTRVSMCCAELLRLDRSMAFVGDSDNLAFEDTVRQNTAKRFWMTTEVLAYAEPIEGNSYDALSNHKSEQLSRS